MTDKYKKLTNREHILHRPGMYMSSIDNEMISTFVFIEDTGRFHKKLLNFNSGLLKIFDEILSMLLIIIIG